MSGPVTDPLVFVVIISKCGGGPDASARPAKINRAKTSLSSQSSVAELKFDQCQHQIMSLDDTNDGAIHILGVGFFFFTGTLQKSLGPCHHFSSTVSEVM